MTFLGDTEGLNNDLPGEPAISRRILVLDHHRTIEPIWNVDQEKVIPPRVEIPWWYGRTEEWRTWKPRASRAILRSSSASDLGQSTESMV